MEEKEPKKIIGLMSGTSCDSIDAGLCEVNPDMSVKLIRGINYSYPEHIRAKIFSAFRGDINIKELCQLNFAIGKCFANSFTTHLLSHEKPLVFWGIFWQTARGGICTLLWAFSKSVRV